MSEQDVENLPLNKPDETPGDQTPAEVGYYEAMAPKVPGDLQAYKYIHTACQTENQMDNRTYYIWYCYPWLVTGLFCTHCQSTFRVGEDGEMEWAAGGGGVEPQTGKCVPPTDTVPMTTVPVPGAPGFFNQLNQNYPPLPEEEPEVPSMPGRASTQPVPTPPPAVPQKEEEAPKEKTK